MNVAANAKSETRTKTITFHSLKPKLRLKLTRTHQQMR